MHVILHTCFNIIFLSGIIKQINQTKSSILCKCKSAFESHARMLTDYRYILSMLSMDGPIFLLYGDIGIPQGIPKALVQGDGLGLGFALARGLQAQQLNQIYM